MTKREPQQSIETNISELEDLLKFGEKTLTSLKINVHNTSYKKFVLFSYTGAVQSYTEAIVLLVRQGKTNAAQVILRSLIEAYININFIFLERNNKNVYRFIAHDGYDRLKMGKKIKNYLLKYPPEQDKNNQMRNLDYWEKFIQETYDSLEKIKKNYPKHTINNIPNLGQRAEIIDKKNNKSNFTWLYLTVYWYFSHWTHLSIRGLNFFFTNNTNGEFSFELNGNQEDAKNTCLTCYALYLEFIILLHDKFEISGEEIKQYKEKQKYYR